MGEFLRLNDGDECDLVLVDFLGYLHITAEPTSEGAPRVFALHPNLPEDVATATKLRDFLTNWIESANVK